MEIEIDLNVNISGRITVLDSPNWRKRWGLVSYWGFENSNDLGLDSHGTNHLTNNNTVTQGTGKVGKAASFASASSEYFSIADNASLSTGDIDFWLAGWANLTNTAADQWLLLKSDSANDGLREYGILNTSGALISFRFGDGLGGAGNQTINFAGATTVNDTWYFWMAYYDASGNTCGISLNGAAFETAALTTTVADTARALNIGRSPAASEYVNGLMDGICFGKQPPLGIANVRNEIRDRLYNGGAGREYPWAA